MRKRRKTAALHFEQLQTQQLAELGSFLRQYRECQGIGLDEIAAITKIQKRLLQAIESGQTDYLPEPVYVRALVRRFAEALKLPGEELAIQFPLEMGSQRPQRGYRKELSMGQLRPIHLYFLYLFVIFSAVNSLSVLMSRSLSQAPPLNTLLTQSQTNATDEFLSQATASGPIREAFPLTVPGSISPESLLAASEDLAESSLSQPPHALQVNQKPVRVQLTIVSQSWIRVIVDGQTAFEGMMLEGIQRTWQADKSITIRAGNAGGIKVAFNNQTPQPLGETGAVEEITYDLGDLAFLP